MPKTYRNRKNRTKKQRGSGLSDVLPITTWGSWANYPGALAWSASTQAPAPLANGGLYTGPQSTGPWASTPFPATQYAEAVEAAKVAGNPDIFYQQRPNDNSGASFSPYVGTPISDKHYSAVGAGRYKKKSRRVGGASRKRNSRKQK
jgi:hypothetical protein